MCSNAWGGAISGKVTKPRLKITGLVKKQKGGLEATFVYRQNR